MHNGFTFLELDVAALAAQPDGVNVTIARSNQSNGNLPNANWNTPLGDGSYTYNVSIVNGQLIVTVNAFASGSWGAVVTNNMANWGNNPNSAIRHQRNASLNLGNVSGTVFMFFHAQNMTFSAFTYEYITGCEPYNFASGTYIVCRYMVCHSIVIYDMNDGSQVNTDERRLGYNTVMPLCDSIEQGYHYFRVALYVGGNFAGERFITVYVCDDRIATVVYGNDIHFGVIEWGYTVTIVCDWC